MTFTPLPSQGSTSWYGWAGDVHSAVNDSTSSAATALRSAYVSVGVTNVNTEAHGDDIQAALDALPSGGGRVWLNKPTYTLAAGLTTTKPNVELIGAGGSGQSPVLGNGATQIVVPSGAWGLTAGSSGSSNYAGITLRRVHFRDAAPGAAAGGVRIVSMDNFLIEDVTVSGFTGASAVGLLIDGSGALSQYGDVRGIRVADSKVGVKINGAGGVRFFGGMFDGNDNSGTVVAGTTGLLVVGGGVHRIYGTVFQYWDTLVDLQSAADLTEIFGGRFEGWTTRALRIAAANCGVYGGSFNNFVGGGVGTGIEVTAAAQNTRLMPGEIAAYATNVSDAGTNTWILLGSGEMLLGSTSYIQVASGAALGSQGADAHLSGSNGLVLDKHLVIGNADYSAGLYLGGVQDTMLQRKAPNVAGTGDDDCFRTGSGATGSRPSASTVGQGSQFFDTSLHKPIWSDGTNWRDASGATV